MPTPDRPFIGVVGGVGPLASAAFVTTLYEQWSGAHEQTAPRVILYSDPSFPDRNVCIVNGDTTSLLDRLIEAINGLHALGATHIVICCMTMHAVLPMVPDALKRLVVSMVDETFDLLLVDPGPHLLLCSLGSRLVRLFEDDERWPAVCERVVLPSMTDQRTVQDLVYGIKRGDDPSRIGAELDGLARAYPADSRVVACSELHMVARYCPPLPPAARAVRWLDPFTLVARRLARASADVPVPSVQPAEQ